MADPMRIRAAHKDGVTEVRVLMSHPMTTAATELRKPFRYSRTISSLFYAEPTRSSHFTFGASLSHKPNTPSK